MRWFKRVAMVSLGGSVAWIDGLLVQPVVGLSPSSHAPNSLGLLRMERFSNGPLEPPLISLIKTTSGAVRVANFGSQLARR